MTINTLTVSLELPRDLLGAINVSEDRVFFDEYPGFVTTKLGPLAGKAELEKVAKKIWE